MDVSESSRQSSATQAAQGEYCGKSFESTRAGQVSNQSIISVRPRRASPLSRGLVFAFAFAVAALSALALSACATRPPATAFDRPATHALPATADTPLRTALAPKETAHPGESGVRLLPTGTEALQARIALARAATKTLDMQYYIANEDNTGKLLLGAALYAADRGVKVRMLVDDLNFKDIDQIMAALPDKIAETVNLGVQQKAVAQKRLPLKILIEIFNGVHEQRLGPLLSSFSPG